MIQIREVCGYFKSRSRFTKGKGPESQHRSMCDLTGRACLKGNGQNFENCYPYQMEKRRWDQLTARGKGSLAADPVAKNKEEANGKEQGTDQLR